MWILCCSPGVCSSAPVDVHAMAPGSCHRSESTGSCPGFHARRNIMDDLFTHPLYSSLPPPPPEGSIRTAVHRSRRGGYLP